MRVNTKYGTGTLLGISNNAENVISYKVLLDGECLNIENEFNKIEKRIYNCNRIWVEFDNSKGELHFNNTLELKILNNEQYNNT